MTADPLVARLRAAGSVFAEDEAAVLRAEAPDPATLQAWVGRRAAGEPLEVIVGFADLDGVRVAVAPGVFVPRRRSLLLARAAVDHLLHSGTADRSPTADRTVVDLCCGTGALGLVVARTVAGVTLHAVDVDPAAVACAAANLAAVGGEVHVGDLDAPLPRHLVGRVDVLIANTPYVPTGAVRNLPPEARDHEPALALDGGADGLALARRVVALAPRWLAPGAIVVVECATTQLDGLVAAARAAGLAAVALLDDDLGATAVRAARGV